VPQPKPGPDLGDVVGQTAGRRAVEVAAAGGHHLFLTGPPGAGKTMLAERLPGLLPSLDDDAALEVTAIHSIAGTLPVGAPLITRPTFEAPHHSASLAALVGGGSGHIRPGAVCRAHLGVLFLDEAPEFSPSVLDALRQPLEDGHVVLHRSGGAVRYPARFQLVLAANPCPCGQPATRCTCPAAVRRRHAQRLSGPLMDRIDLRLRVDPVPHADLFGLSADREPSTAVATRVSAARGAAADRWAGRWRLNAEVPGPELRSRRWLPPVAAMRGARASLDRGELSARGFDRVLRLAWTLADLAGRGTPTAEDVGEALFFRTGRASS
jgi:magnesium chelatase family protein